MNRKNVILITSAGGLTGTYLCNYYKRNTSYKVITIDMGDLVAVSNFSDKHYQVPATNDKNYIEFIKNILEKENVNIIIPTTSYDIDLYSKKEIKEILGKEKFLVMDYEYHNILHNKDICYKYLYEKKICTPTIYKTINEAVFPCILKPVKSSGSKNIIKLDNLYDYEYWKNKINDFILVEYLEGKEYTVDCLFDKNGKCMGANVRERIKMNGGGAVITRNDYYQYKNIIDVVKILENTAILKGPINFQYKIKGDNQCCIFDFNTRLASGGLPLTVKSGFDIPNMLVDLILGNHVDKWKPTKKSHRLTMIKYYEEIYRNIL